MVADLRMPSRAAVELVIPKHRNERKYRMALITSYHVPGLYVEDHSIDVPLDWRGLEPMLLAVGSTMRRGAMPAPIAGAPESIKLFYRVVCAPDRINDDLPLLLFLQGGPGGESPRPLSPTSDGWIEEAVKHFRVVLPDQRGTGRSSCVDGRTIKALGDRATAAGADTARSQADFLKRHLASSIVRDFEYLRLVGFGGKPWVTLGQSYGGFLTLSYLSLFPEGVAASFTCGGIPHVPASASEVYAHTFPRMAAKTQQYYDRYPADIERVAALADALEAQKPVLPDGSPMTVERLQLMGSDFGMKPSFERMHWIIDHAFADGDGTLTCDASVSDSFLMRAFERTNTRTNPLYWTLQEFIYADGDTMPIGWAAAEEKAHRAEFDTLARPLMFTGEAMFPWMFEQMPELMPFKPAMDLLMEDTSWDKIYDPQRLACNEVPLQAAVYFDDMYVDSGLQLDTLSRVGNSHAWVTNEFEHDGLHGSVVFKHLFDEASTAETCAGSSNKGVSPPAGTIGTSPSAGTRKTALRETIRSAVFLYANTIKLSLCIAGFSARSASRRLLAIWSWRRPAASSSTSESASAIPRATTIPLGSHTSSTSPSANSPSTSRIPTASKDEPRLTNAFAAPSSTVTDPCALSPSAIHSLRGAMSRRSAGGSNRVPTLSPRARRTSASGSSPEQITL